jgi:hypothetical protein
MAYHIITRSSSAYACTLCAHVHASDHCQRLVLACSAGLTQNNYQQDTDILTATAHQRILKFHQHMLLLIHVKSVMLCVSSALLH